MLAVIVQIAGVSSVNAQSDNDAQNNTETTNIVIEDVVMHRPDYNNKEENQYSLYWRFRTWFFYLFDEK